MNQLAFRTLNEPGFAAKAVRAAYCRIVIRCFLPAMGFNMAASDSPRSLFEYSCLLSVSSVLSVVAFLPG